MYAMFKQTNDEKADGFAQVAFFNDLEEANMIATSLWLDNQELNIFVREIKDPKRRGFFDSKGLKALVEREKK